MMMGTEMSMFIIKKDNFQRQRKLYEDGKIKSSEAFEDVLANVLFNCKEI